jgi:hypothetical protein
VNDTLHKTLEFIHSVTLDDAWYLLVVGSDSFFHVGNTGSNPVGDAKNPRNLAAFSFGAYPVSNLVSNLYRNWRFSAFNFGHLEIVCLRGMDESPVVFENGREGDAGLF